MHLPLLSFGMAHSRLRSHTQTRQTNLDVFSLSSVIAHSLTEFVSLSHIPKNYEIIPCILPYVTQYPALTYISMVDCQVVCQNLLSV